MGKDCTSSDGKLLVAGRVVALDGGRGVASPLMAGWWKATRLHWTVLHQYSVRVDNSAILDSSRHQARHFVVQRLEASSERHACLRDHYSFAFNAELYPLNSGTIFVTAWSL
ncbi:hypothetical protein EMCRGX_G026339 [Ephydatia muelleri]